MNFSEYLKNLNINKKPGRFFTYLSGPEDYLKHLGALAIEYEGQVKGNLLNFQLWPEHYENYLKNCTKNGLVKFTDLNAVTWSYLISTLEYPKSALILGAGHVGLALSSIFKYLSYQVSILDDREEFLKKAINADFCLNTSSFEEIPEASSNGSPYDVVCIVTRGHREDFKALKRVLSWSTQPSYIGMIGSRKRTKELFDSLLETGYSEEILKRIHAPIGLQIGAQTPEEIAISIAAEVIACQNNCQIVKSMAVR